MTMKTFLITAAALVLSLPAFGSTIATYNFTQDDCSGQGCGSMPAGQVVVTTNQINPGDIQLDFVVSLFNGNEFVNTGLTGLVFDIQNAPTLLAENTLSSGFTFLGLAPGSIHEDGLGTFEYGFSCTACGNGGSNPVPGPLHFTIDVPNAADVLATNGPNGTGFYIGADIMSGQTGQTGAVGATLAPTAASPEPMTFAMLGCGLITLGLLDRRFRRR